MQQLKPFMVDISFLQSVIDGYKIGLFDDIKSVRIMNALDSLAQYGNVKHYIEVPDRPQKPREHKYTKRSEYWDKTKQEASK